MSKFILAVEVCSFGAGIFSFLRDMSSKLKVCRVFPGTDVKRKCSGATERGESPWTTKF